MHPSMQGIDPKKRTTIQIQLYQDPWPLIMGWGQHHKLKMLGTPQEGLVVFQKGWGVQNIAFNVEGTILTIQAWVRFSTLERIRSMFILPAEMGAESGGMRGVLGRRFLRNMVNEILAHLQAPQIQ